MKTVASKHNRQNYVKFHVRIPKVKKMQIGLLKFARHTKYLIQSRGKKLWQKMFNEKYLLYTNVAISISSSALGDIIEQNYEIMSEQIDFWDPIRSRNMTTTGISVGILSHYWYIFLDRKLPGRTKSTVAKKVLLDQLICSPVLISTYLLTLAILERKSKDEFIAEAKGKAWRLYGAEWVIWPTAQVINFYILPTKYRMLYDSVISLGYDVYASHIIHDHS